MADWGSISGSAAVSSGDLSFIKNNTTTADSVFTKTQGSLGGNFQIIGLNANKISDIKTVISTYISEVDAIVDQLDTSISANNAVRGDGVDAAVKQYATSVKESIKSFTSGLLAFNEQLDAVAAAYTAYTQSLGDTVSSSAGDVNSSFSKYSAGGNAPTN